MILFVGAEHEHRRAVDADMRPLDTCVVCCAAQLAGTTTQPVELVYVRPSPTARRRSTPIHLQRPLIDSAILLSY